MNVSAAGLRHQLGLQSAMLVGSSTEPPSEPAYTDFTSGFQGCLDYIWFSAPGLKVEAVLDMPAHELVTLETALPNSFFPSDHLQLKAQFSFL
jgi:mRNA deadenylase 3'-5' endonuclease subunit Ccr4